MQETPVRFLGGRDLLEKGQATHSNILGLPVWLSCKESTCNAGDLGLIPGLGRSPGEGKGYALQYSGLENSMDYIDQGTAESDTTETFIHITSALLGQHFQQLSLALKGFKG